MSSFPRRWHSRWHTLLARGLATLAATGVAGARPAWADCASPTPAIVWSYPAQGATEVPTNADLWLLISGWSAPARVSLEDADLPELELPSGYDLGELEPNTEYTLDIQAADGARTFELTFTTGSGPVALDPNAAPGTVTASSSLAHVVPPLAPLCQAARNTQDCFDQGQDTYYEFAPTGHAVGWLIASEDSFRPINVWPGECGAPRLFAGSFTAPCVTLYGIDESGTPHGGEKICSTPPGPGHDTSARPQPATGSPGGVLPPASAPRSDGERAASTSPAPGPSQATGCALPRAPSSAGRAWWALALLACVGRSRAARTGLRGTR